MKACSILAVALMLCLAFGASAMAQTDQQGEATVPPPAGPRPETRFLYQSDKRAVRDVAEFAKDFRPPTAEEIEKLGTFWPQVPEEENAAYWFALAGDRLRTDDAPPGSHENFSEPHFFAGDVEGFEEYVDTNRDALELARKGIAQGTHCSPITVYAPKRFASFEMGYFSKTRKLARAFVDLGFLCELKGRPDAAADAYLDCIRLGDKLREQATIIEYLVAHAIIWLGQGSLDNLVAGGDLSEETLRTVIEECRRAESDQKEPLAIWERDTALDEAAKAVLGAPQDEKEPELWQMASRHRKAVNAVLQEKTLNELLQQDVMDGLYKNELKEFADERVAGWVPAIGMKDVYLRATEIRAAIVLYQKKHGGAVPETLDELCPDILPAVPTDPFSGKPMRYAKAADGWKVWSVGNNNANDGGEGAARYRSPAKEPDVVFFSNVRSNIEYRSRVITPESAAQVK